MKTYNIVIIKEIAHEYKIQADSVEKAKEKLQLYCSVGRGKEDVKFIKEKQLSVRYKGAKPLIFKPSREKCLESHPNCLIATNPDMIPGEHVACEMCPMSKEDT